MQQIVSLRISIRKFQDTHYSKTELGLTKQRYVLLQRSEEVVTDRLLVSDEGVRLLDERR